METTWPSMQPPATRKRVKRLLRLLKSQQYYDTILTPATVMSFKYLLPYNNLCTRIRVKFTRDPVTGRKEEAFVRHERHRGCDFEFILSQLEAWKITDPENKDTVVVPLALDIFLKCVVYDFEGEKAYPTVITWPCPIRHRTLYFFAYLNFDMPSGQYTIPELLALRQKGERSRELFEKSLEPENDLAALFRQNGISDWKNMVKDLYPPNILATLTGKESSVDKTPKQHRDDSSSSSEEVLFKGTARRRQATSRETVVSRQAEPKGEMPKGEMGWKYPGRNNSDPSATEPLSAPTGLPAQKSEGFQRFYKAVVSPTHVRVTAGGRIVPNTRGPPSSPTMKRSQEGSVTGSALGHERATGNVTPAGMPMGAGMGQHMPPVMPPFFPGYGHPSYQAYGPQMPFFPMPYGHPMAGGYPPFPYPMPMMRQPSVDSALKDTLNLKTGDGQVDNGDDQNKGNKIETAPPTQFDQRRPYFYNGQWMYPVHGPYSQPAGPMGGPYMPMPMHMPMHMPMARGSVPAMSPHMPASVQPSQLGSPIKFNGPAAALPPARALPGPGIVAPAAPAVSGLQASPAPPISSIRPSEITRKQIGIFRKSLKYHEDQLQYNRHQIDEKDTEQKIQKYRDDIARFECMMQVQIEDEKKRGYPPLSEKDKSSDGSSGSDMKSSTVSEGLTVDGVAAEQPAVAPGPPVGLSSSAEPSDQVIYTSRSPDPQQTDEAAKKSGLPSGAALAPPFEPRKDAPLVPTVIDRTTPMWTVPGYPKQDVNGSYGSFMAGTQPWEAPVSRPEPPMFSHPAGQSFDANVTSVTSKGYLGVPYLIGSLPRGMNPRTAKDIDYQYSRELTEDELRARHLYWGKVPRSAVRGLPKYDGRHFYPPSPVKDTATDRSALESGGDLLSFTPKPIGDKPDAQPPRPSTPVGSALIPCDSFEQGQQTGQGDIYLVTESAKACDKLGSAKGKSEAGVDSASVISYDRRAEKPGGARLWEVVLKKGSSAALSSTTAEGKLQPQYAGSAAASLSPTVNRTSEGRASVSPGKESVDASEGGASLTPVPERRGKNRALNGEASHEQLVSDGSVGVPTTSGA
ncbi:hypothetical protein CONLIGDRAFT_458080 [Coniochaeta ligniaria NRRL 30616]|uniref:Uncharacterized protein n=1 Tax=Coniochaeta ligniaria NRRL 30616 TaxID=1408157 RepID=A0A1J7IL26_9PEZI|nr:hypothetical protein CONLIGDRAFT_458080 [Coniochaeta ligniaria NRRL 30616]